MAADTERVLELDGEHAATYEDLRAAIVDAFNSGQVTRVFQIGVLAATIRPPFRYRPPQPGDAPQTIQVSEEPARIEPAGYAALRQAITRARVHGEVTWLSDAAGRAWGGIAPKGAIERRWGHPDARTDETTRLARLLALLVADRGLNRFAAVTEDSELSRELERFLRDG